MANETTLKTRVIHKHDIEANWLKASNFIPKQGEIIVYDDRYVDDSGSVIIVADHPRYKIGDGINPINLLAFTEESSLSPELCNIESVADIIFNEVPAQGICRVAGVEGVPADVVIPGIHNGLSVVAIQSTAFAKNTNINRVYTADPIDIIGKQAFDGCTNLEYIKFASSITEIGAQCFRDCTKLNNIKLPESLITISDAAFARCYSLTEIVLPYMESLPNQLFLNCNKLQKLVIPSTIKSIGTNAVGGCSSLTIYTDASDDQIASWNANSWNPLNRPIIKISSEDIARMIAMEDSIILMSEDSVPSTLVQRGAGGTIVAATPINDNEVTTKSYVDAAILDIDVSKDRLDQKASKAVINFQFDDGQAEDVDVKALFDQYGLKCGFALVGGDDFKTDTERQVRYHGYQDEGFEILAHSVNSGPFDSMASNIPALTEYAQTCYDNLTEAGFDIHGWVTPSSRLRADMYEPLTRIYDYGFGYIYEGEQEIHHYGETPRICQLRRVRLSNEIADIKAYIDEAVATNGFLTLYGHGTQDCALVNLTEILAHCVDIGVDVLTPGKAVQKFFKERYDTELKSATRLNKTISNAGVAFGRDTIAGIASYRVIGQMANDLYLGEGIYDIPCNRFILEYPYSDMTSVITTGGVDVNKDRQLRVDDVISLIYSQNFDNVGTIIAIEEDTYTGNTIITIDKEITFSAYHGDLEVEFKYLRCNAKPEAGNYVTANYQLAGGIRSKALMDSSFSWGRDCVSDGKFGATFGTDTRASYAGFAANRKTTAAGRDAAAFNYSTESLGDGSFTAGFHTLATNEYQAAFGKYNEEDPNAIFMVGNGYFDGLNDVGVRKTAFSVNLNGTASVQSDPIKANDVATKNYVDLYHPLPDIETNFTEGLQYTYHSLYDMYRVSGVDDGVDVTNLRIPGYYEGKKVFGIIPNAFQGRTDIKTVEMSDNITVIGEYAFDACTAIESVVFSKNLTQIDRWSFRGCTSLTEIILPNKVSTIGIAAFANNTNLSKAFIPASLTSITTDAFLRCSNADIYTPLAALPGDVTLSGIHSITYNATYNPEEPVHTNISGNISVSTPTASNHATNKTYVDNLVSGFATISYVDEKASIPKNTTKTDSNPGKPIAYVINTSNKKVAIPISQTKDGAANDIVRRDSAARIQVPNPENDYDAVPKTYVDTSMQAVADKVLEVKNIYNSGNVASCNIIDVRSKVSFSLDLPDDFDFTSIVCIEVRCYLDNGTNSDYVLCTQASGLLQKKAFTCAMIHRHGEPTTDNVLPCVIELSNTSLTLTCPLPASRMFYGYGVFMIKYLG